MHKTSGLVYCKKPWPFERPISSYTVKKRPSKQVNKGSRSMGMSRPRHAHLYSFFLTDLETFYIQTVCVQTVFHLLTNKKNILPI